MAQNPERVSIGTRLCVALALFGFVNLDDETRLARRPRRGLSVLASHPRRIVRAGDDDK
jgi:hypothetical protein